MLVAAFFFYFTPAGHKSVLDVSYEWNTVVRAHVHISYHIVRCTVFSVKYGKMSTEEGLSFHECSVMLSGK